MVPKSTSIDVPDCNCVGGHGVVPRNETLISPGELACPYDEYVADLIKTLDRLAKFGMGRGTRDRTGNSWSPCEKSSVAEPISAREPEAPSHLGRDSQGTRA